MKRPATGVVAGLGTSDILGTRSLRSRLNEGREGQSPFSKLPKKGTVPFLIH